MSFATPARADNVEGSLHVAINVAPDVNAATRLSASLPAGAATADDASYSSRFAAGAAVASDDSSAAGTALTDGADAVSAAALLVGCPGEEGGLFGCLTCRPCPCVYGDVEALFLQQVPHFQNQPIAVNWRTKDSILSTSDLTPDVSPALRATFGFHLCDCRPIEFTYFGMFNNGASAGFEKTDPNSVVTFPTGPVGNVFLNMDRIVTNYTSYLNSFEANLPCCCGCCCENSCGCDQSGCPEASCEHAKCKPRDYLYCRSVEWFAGFRYMELGSHLDIEAQSFPAPFTETGNYTIDTTNRLFGGQIGGRLRRTVNRFGFELSGDVGIYDNDATQTQTVTDFPNFALRPTRTTTNNNVAFLGELNLSGIFRLTDVWSVKAGYNVIWIEGLALAPDQLDFNFATSSSGNQLSHDGGMFLHGANVGLEARW